MESFAQTFALFQDHLAPRLDVYEQAIYLYVLRHTRLEGQRESVFPFKSARRQLAFGVGKAGSPPSEAVVYEKVRSLQQKGCLKVLSSERAGTRIEVFLPDEIDGVLPRPATSPSYVDIEELDFFSVQAYHKLDLPPEPVPVDLRNPLLKEITPGSAAAPARRRRLFDDAGLQTALAASAHSCCAAVPRCSRSASVRSLHAPASGSGTSVR